jgi:hypothetical protein
VGSGSARAEKAQGLLWVKLRSPDAQQGSRLCPQEQTLAGGPVRSENLHKSGNLT